MPVSDESDAVDDVVRAMRQQRRDVPLLVLYTDIRTRMSSVYPVVTQWAIQQLQALNVDTADLVHATGGANRDAVAAAAAALLGQAGHAAGRDDILRLSQGWGGAQTAGTPAAEPLPHQQYSDIIEVLRRTVRHRYDQARQDPPSLPPQYEVLSVDRLIVARRIAHQLEIDVQLESGLEGTELTIHHIDRRGHVDRIGDNGEPEPLASAIARLPEQLRQAAAGLPNVAELYRESWARQRTFEQAVREAFPPPPPPPPPTPPGDETEQAFQARLRERYGADGLNGLLHHAAMLIREHHLDLAANLTLPDRFPDRFADLEQARNLGAAEQVQEYFGGMGPLHAVITGLRDGGTAGAVTVARSLGPTAATSGPVAEPAGLRQSRLGHAACRTQPAR